MPGQFGKDGCDLRGSLPFSEDDFRHASTQRAVMIDLGEAKIFKRHVTQTCDRVVGRDFSLADILEKFADGCSVHERF